MSADQSRRKMQMSIGLYGDVTMTRNVYLALISSYFLAGAIAGASLVGWFWIT